MKSVDVHQPRSGTHKPCVRSTRISFESQTIRYGWASGAAVLLAIFLGASPVAAFGNLIAFGASLTDQGNVQALAISGGFADPTPASAGYFEGRFTNGINAADVLNQSIEGTNSVGSTFGGDNFAFGGARAQENFDGIPDLPTQIALYSATLGGSPIPSDTLIMMSMGAMMSATSRSGVLRVLRGRPSSTRQSPRSPHRS